MTRPREPRTTQEETTMTNETREAKLSAAFVKLADTLIADFDVVDLLHWLVEECTQILDTQAGGLLLASTSEEAELVEILQLAAGGGPCLDCFRMGKPVTVGDIGAESAKWPRFSAEALKQGFRSVHATPLRLRGQTIGTMNLFSTHVGQLAPADITVAQALADLATIGILQERNIRSANVVSEQLQHALDSRILIEQAKGVLAATTGMNMNERTGPKPYFEQGRRRRNRATHQRRSPNLEIGPGWHGTKLLAA
jgi:GAF domain-containing protein